MNNSRYTAPLDYKIARLVDELNVDAREFYEERAGILEYDGGHDRRTAESLAWDETQRYIKQRP